MKVRFTPAEEVAPTEDLLTQAKVAIQALTRAMHKLPMKCRIVRRDETVEV